MNFIKLELVAFATIVKGWFAYIFPECPAVGVVVVGTALVMFFFYSLKSGYERAFQMTAWVTGGALFILLTLHYLNSLFFHWFAT